MNDKKNGCVQPHDHEAEAGMLACVMLAPKAQAAVILSKLTDDLWDDKRHRLIHAAMVQLKKEGKALDQVAVYQKLKDCKVSDGIKDYVLTLPDWSPSAWNWPTYYDTIVDRAWRRRVLEQLRVLMEEVQDTSKPVSAFRAMLQPLE